MKTGALARLAALVALAAPTVVAQLPAEISNLPDCAISCLGQSISKTQCSPSDVACICRDEPLQEALTACVMEKCSVPDSLVAKNITSTSCGLPVRDRHKTYVATSNAFGIITGVIVLLRVGYKLWAGLEFGLDDVFTLATTLMGVPSTVFNATVLPQNGIGRDVWTQTPTQITNFARIFYVMEILYFAEVALLKLAMLFFYVRIFPAANVRRLLMGTIVIVSLFGLAYVLAAIFQCTPISYHWHQWDGMHHGKCINLNGLAWSNAIMSIVLDIWMLAIPLWQLKILRMDWKKKAGVAIMFCVGTFVTVVSILRLHSLVKFGLDADNPTWEFYNVGLWSTIEINVGIVCVCLPTLRLMLVRLFPMLRSSTQRYYDGRYANSASAGDRQLRRPSRTLGTAGTDNSIKGAPSTSKADASLNQITMQTTYAVEYRDLNDMRLKYLGDVGSHASSGRTDDSLGHA
ncbi:hypothetical protein CDD81_7164 [Ophiocordyceps australis]|uniref:CFEM domain-containing protein n=1 Tax=Ophiocordyceps australis TaxID=1399860 RepID=A0A2C5XYV9_9HYPO|nr:hypothetical protein CDD81_7164 [Ophiocordyceps australis]